MELQMDLGLVAILHKDPLLPIAAVDLVMVNGDDPPTGNTASTLLTSVSVQSPMDPVTTVLLGHHNPPITRLLLPPTYVPYFASSLTVLSLADNQLESLPTTLWSLTNLRELNLNHNALGHLSPFIGRLMNLIELHVSHNQLKALPTSLPNSIEVLDVSHNQLPWAPGVLTKLKNLRRLWISDNPMSFSAFGPPTDNAHTLPAAYGGTPIPTASIPPSFPPPAIGSALSSAIRSHIHPQSLRDLALQAVSLQLRHRGLHAYCRHHPDHAGVEQDVRTRHFAKCVARDLRLVGASQDSTDLWLSDMIGMERGQPSAHLVNAGAVTWDQAMALADGELGDYDPYAGQPNAASVAANVAQVPASAVDAEFGAMVWSKVKLAARQALRREWGLLLSQRLPRMAAPTASHQQNEPDNAVEMDQVPPGIDPHPPLPQPGNESTYSSHHKPTAKLTIDTMKSQLAHQIHSCPVSPGIRGWTAGLPPPTPSKASPTHGDSPGTPSFPSPPSAYASYCISQVIPSGLLLSLVVPSATCDVCGNGIHRMLDRAGQAQQQQRELRFSAIQNVAGGNLVPVSWTVCGVKCWHTIQGQVVKRVRLGR